MAKNTEVAWATLYPEQQEVYQTSDGLVHLQFTEAQAQAAHLLDATITTVPLLLQGKAKEKTAK